MPQSDGKIMRITVFKGEMRKILMQIGFKHRFRGFRELEVTLYDIEERRLCPSGAGGAYQ